MERTIVWRCPVCGYTAIGYTKKQEHIQQAQRDPLHITYYRDNRIIENLTPITHDL